MSENGEDLTVRIDEADTIPPDTRIEHLRYKASPGYGYSNVLSFPVAIVHELAERGVVCLRDLSALSPEDLLAIDGLGESRVGWLSSAARKAGVRFADDGTPSVLLRIDGEAAEALVRYADEVGLTPSELATAALDENIGAVVEWAGKYASEMLLEQAEALTQRAKSLAG